MSYLDAHKDIVTWSSEEFSIPYRSPFDNKLHRYFPDFFIKKRNIDGTTESLVVEIKPLKETRPPDVPLKKSRQYLREVYTWGINSAKWKAAEDYCKDRRWKFIVMTEKELGIKF